MRLVSLVFDFRRRMAAVVGEFGPPSVLGQARYRMENYVGKCVSLAGRCSLFGCSLFFYRVGRCSWEYYCRPLGCVVLACWGILDCFDTVLNCFFCIDGQVIVVCWVVFLQRAGLSQLLCIFGMVYWAVFSMESGRRSVLAFRIGLGFVSVEGWLSQCVGLFYRVGLSYRIVISVWDIAGCSCSVARWVVLACCVALLGFVGVAQNIGIPYFIITKYQAIYVMGYPRTT